MATKKPPRQTRNRVVRKRLCKRVAGERAGEAGSAHGTNYISIFWNVNSLFIKASKSIAYIEFRIGTTLLVGRIQGLPISQASKKSPSRFMA